MIISTTQEFNGELFKYTYSDAHMLIEQDQTGQLYQDALDVLGATYTYTETNIPIDDGEEDVYAEAGKILLGVE